MLIKITPDEAEEHLRQLEVDPDDETEEYMRLGVCVSQWDNGMGCGVLKLHTLDGPQRVVWLHYQ